MIRWCPGGWRWLLRVQKLRCAGRSLCWGPECWPSGRGPAGFCTGPPTNNIKTSIKNWKDKNGSIPRSKQTSGTYIFGSPDFDRPVLRRRVKQPVSSPLHTRDGLSVTSQDLLTAAQHGVPNTNRAVFRAAGQISTLWIADGSRAAKQCYVKSWWISQWLQQFEDR